MTDARTIPACPICRTDCAHTLAHAVEAGARDIARRLERSEAADFMIWPDDPRWSLAPTVAVAA